MNTVTNPFNNKDLEPKQLFEKLNNYYYNNSVYEGVRPDEDVIKGLVTPVNRSVNFFADKIIPGDLTNVSISTENEQLKDAIQQVWKWGNFAAKKQVAVRQLALFGNLFFKAMVDEKKTWFETVDPRYVTKFKLDSRDFLTEIRIDVPIVIEDKAYTHTEYWSKTDNYYAIWVHQRGAGASLDTLGDPSDYGALVELGIDFIPFTHTKFLDSGNDWGDSCVLHALDKIDDANRLKAQLEYLAFNYGEPNMIVKSISPDGRPAPAVKATELQKVMGGKAYALPSNFDIGWTIQNLPYADLLEISKSTLTELEQDLPELKYYSIDSGQLSGNAIKQLLSGAISRANEARGNFIQSLIRINEMCLTLGSINGLFSVGSYENGDFDHSIQCPEMFETTLAEKAANVKAFVESGMALATAMRLSGYSEQEVLAATSEKQLQDEKTSELDAKSLADTMQFNRV